MALPRHPALSAMALETLKKIAAAWCVRSSRRRISSLLSTERQIMPVLHFEKLDGYDNAMALVTRTALSRTNRAAIRTSHGSQNRSSPYVNRELLDPNMHADSTRIRTPDSIQGRRRQLLHAGRWRKQRARLPDDAACRDFILRNGQPTPVALAPDRRIVLRSAMTPEQLAAKLKIPVADAREKIAEGVR